jgi:predicted GIY-YIG superfamily endonuclease
LHCVSKWRSLAKRSCDKLNSKTACLFKLNVNETVSSILAQVKEKYEIDILKQRQESINDHWPLLKSTSDQLGINSSVEHVHDLITASLGKASQIERNFFGQWISVTPSAKGRRAIEKLCQKISTGVLSVGTDRPLNPQAVYALMCAGGNCQDFHLLQKIHTRLLSRTRDEDLHSVACETTRVSVNFQESQKKLTLLRRHIEEYLCSVHNHDSDKYNSIQLPEKFLSRNEVCIIKCEEAFDMVAQARKALCCSVANAGFNSKDIVYNARENDVSLTSCFPNSLMYSASSKRRNTQRKSSFTNKEIEDALWQYLHTCKESVRMQKKVLGKLCKEILAKYGDVLKIFLKSELICRCIHSHLAEVLKKGWRPADIEYKHDVICVDGLFPYWLSQASAVSNNVVLKQGHPMLMTGPNSYGKTTFLRSLVACGLLAVSGFHLPASRAKFPPLQKFFLRLPGADRPVQNLSSFQTEMRDLQHILRATDEKTVVCLDELARSTSPEEGFALVRSVLDFLSNKPCFCIFSTHFLQLPDHAPMQVRCTTFKKKYVLTEGVCISSKSLEVCLESGISSNIVDKAFEHLRKKRKFMDFQQASKSDKLKIVEIATKITGTEPHLVKKGALVPPFLTSKPAVYLICEPGNKFYCGETKNVVERQKTHKAVHKRTGDMFVFSVRNKSDALQFECLIQRECFKQNIQLSTYSDSYHKI